MEIFLVQFIQYITKNKVHQNNRIPKVHCYRTNPSQKYASEATIEIFCLILSLIEIQRVQTLRDFVCFVQPSAIKILLFCSTHQYFIKILTKLLLKIKTRQLLSNVDLRITSFCDQLVIPHSKQVYNFELILIQMKFIVLCYLILQVFSTYMLSLTVNQSATVIHVVLLAVSSFFYVMVSYKNPGYYNDLTQAITDQLETAPETIQKQLKICKKCKIQQLLRTKHCYNCGKCVATFDHHCIWVGNCIGEKNRPTFICCLISNILQIGHAMLKLIVTMWQKGEKYTYQIAFLSFLGIILSAIVVLFVMHCYLMVANLTTWQIVSWNKIFYLSNRRRSQRSPFCQGWLRNIKEYWNLGCTQDFKIWSLQQQQSQQKIKLYSSQAQITQVQ